MENPAMPNDRVDVLDALKVSESDPLRRSALALANWLDTDTASPARAEVVMRLVAELDAAERERDGLWQENSDLKVERALERAAVTGGINVPAHLPRSLREFCGLFPDDSQYQHWVIKLNRESRELENLRAEVPRLRAEVEDLAQSLARKERHIDALTKDCNAMALALDILPPTTTEEPHA